jgi:hypothetical protein
LGIERAIGSVRLTQTVGLRCCLGNYDRSLKLIEGLPIVSAVVLRSCTAVGMARCCLVIHALRLGFSDEDLFEMSSTFPINAERMNY